MLAAALAAILVLNTAGVAYAKEALIPQISGYPLPVSDNVREHSSDDTTHVTAKIRTRFRKYIAQDVRLFYITILIVYN